MPKATTTTAKPSNPKTATSPNQKKTPTKPQTQPVKKGSVKVETKDAKNLKNPVKNTKPVVTSKQTQTKGDNKKKPVVESENAPKQNRMANVEKGDAANKGTAYIGATFNVNLASKALKSYITNTLGLEIGSINAQYAYTAATEVLALHIVRSSGKFNAKNTKKANLYEITFENVSRGIRESSE